MGRVKLIYIDRDYYGLPGRYDVVNDDGSRLTPIPMDKAKQGRPHGGAALWVADILELYEGEWLTAQQLHLEVEDRGRLVCSLWSVRQALYRLLRKGTIRSRSAVAPHPANRRKEYSWLR